MDDRDIEAIRFVLARVGLANVKESGLAWEHFAEFLSRLGYHVRVEVTPAGL